MWTTSSRDNWERLVAAVIKREQIWQLCHQDSITTVNSDFSERNLSFSSASLRSVSSSTSPQLPLTNDSVVEVTNSGSGTITQKLFSALLWRKKPKDYGLVGISEDHFGLGSFSLRELLVATDHFSNKNIVGKSTHSKVYKGRLPDGSLVAVKRYTAEADQVMIEKELEISSIVAHRYVIGLRGFCTTEKERLLVYPYMANGSVAQCLRERYESQPPLDWAIRPRIALGVARGLAYLHHGCIRGIIHGDVKAANILLDEGFEAVVADFNLAKFMDCNDDNVVRGTIGHIAPEYLSTGKCSLKTDVYGYGVFLLELITGQRAFDLARLANDDDVMLLNWVKKCCEMKHLHVMVDQDLKGNYVDEEVEMFLQIVLICTQSDPEGRPTMSEVVRMIEDGDGLAETWEEFFQNAYQDENHSSKLHPSSEWIINDSSSDVSADHLSGPR